MATRQPIAFLSYVRSDDEHDGGRISAFRERLEGEVRMQTGKPFAIFQDRNDIAWGQNWEERINSSLSDVTFLIPIVTPSFFQSPACRSEFQAFLLKEKTLGVNRLILPVHYVSCEELGEDYIKHSNEIAENLRTRNWTDWRPLRFKSLNDEAVAAALATLAGMIKASMSELTAISIVASAKPEMRASTETISDFGLPKILSEAQIPPSGTVESDATEEQAETAAEYDVAEARPDDPHDPKIWKIAFEYPYYAYTKKYDEVIEAAELADRAELMKLHKYLSSFVRAMKKLHDTGIAQTVSGFRSKEGRRLAVSILIDNSGSMRGRPITITAAWSLLIGEWLDRLGVSTEILGFTTRAWKGGNHGKRGWRMESRQIPVG
jgi:cobaltochelatase CobT